MLALLLNSKRGPQFKYRLGPFCVEFACSACARMGSLLLLWVSPALQTEEVGWEGVSVSVVCVCVGLLIEW